MTIERVASRFDITPRTLHYYEEIGLIAPVSRTAGGHRLYDEAVVRKIEDILRIKENLGYSLHEIKRILDIEQKLDELKDSYHKKEACSSDREEILDQSILLLTEFVSRIDSRLEKLQQIRSSIQGRLDRANALKKEKE